ncbi:MAG TPA: inosine/xanthosine triphosphatase [Anaerolineaceae bacterium]|nr:inosine/xanthosine triphosphatase [Anaerolineaceae bacterium]
MKLVYLASENPVKIAAVEEGFRRVFTGEEFSVRSVSLSLNLPAQPKTDAETLFCAEQRAANARETAPDGDYWVGIEGGTSERGGEMGTFAWVVILDSLRRGIGRSGEFFLPKILADLVRQGMELGDADDLVFARQNSKQKNGAVGLLTADAIDRLELYIPAVIFALIPFKNPLLFP